MYIYICVCVRVEANDKAKTGGRGGRCGILYELLSNVKS